MKRNMKKVTAVLAACATMATVFTGCGDTKQTTTTETQESTVATESTVTSETEVKEEFSYPMDGRKVTVTNYLPGGAKKTVSNMGDTEFTKALEEATGIDVEFTHDTGNTAEWFSFMIAEGKYTDIIEWTWTDDYPGSMKAAYEDGIIIKLNDIIEQYMPNFKAWCEENPELVKYVTDDEGNFYGIPFVKAPNGTSTFGIYARQDWLDELGIKMPTTIDEWHDALIALKEKHGFAPIVTQSNGFLKTGAFLNAYAPQCLSSRYSVNPETGAVEYTQATDGYREYITTLAQWYEEGLIDKDFISYDAATVKAKFLNNQAAVSWGYAGSSIQTTLQEAAELNPDMKLVACPFVSKEEGAEIIYNSCTSRLSAMHACITTQCKDIEAAARYLDYYWSEEGILLANFGIEGVSYTMENGVPTYTDEILNNPDGLGVKEAMGKYIRSYAAFAGPEDSNYHRGFYSQTPSAAEAGDIWSSEGSSEYLLPKSFYFSTEEKETLSTIETELNSYADEMIVKFVIGTEDIEAKWDEFVKICNQYGMQDAIGVWSAAYNRLQAK